VSGRLVGFCSAVVDLVLHVPHLPVRGGDVLATSSRTEVGGGLNSLRAATYAGVRAAYAGGHGTGPFGDLVRAALAAASVPTLLPQTEDEDSGCCVVLVDGAGERTFATTVGAEGHLSPERLSAWEPRPGDSVYVSGYDLCYPHGPVVADTVARLPMGTTVLLDPGPLVGDIPPEVLAAVLDRSTWVSLNAAEASAATDEADPAAAAQALLGRHRTLAGVVVRTGADGCVLAVRGAEPAAVAGPPVRNVVDTNGAGDVHAGTFLAGLATGRDPVDAAAAANAAAARSVAYPGPGLPWPEASA
jgi:sugar/nucleoside kinase (ribokinase family)